MKRIFGIIMACILTLGLLGYREPAEAKEAFDILYHNVDITVNENGSLDVVEEMKVQFSAARHGIYVNIPTEYKMNWIMEDGSEKVRYYEFPVSNVRVLSGHEYETEHNSYYVRIKMGDARKYADTFETYKWSYTINTRDLGLDGIEMVFLNIITSGWDTTTASVDFSLTFPKPIDASKIHTSTPAGNMLVGTGELDGLTVSMSGNRIIGSYHDVISATSGITIQVLLEEGYFDFPNINNYGLVAMSVGALFTLAVGILFAIYGKDRPLVQSVEFHVPAGVNSAEVGTIIDEEVNDNDVMSLILDWGRRGLLTINETKATLHFRKIRDIEPEARDYEKEMFADLFARGDDVNTTALTGSFYKTIHKTKDGIERYFSDKQRALSTETSIAMQIVLALFSFLPVVLMTFVTGYAYYRQIDMYMIAVVFQIILLIGCTYLAAYLYKRRYIVELWSRISRILLYLLSGLLYGIPVLLMFIILNHTGTSLTQGAVVALVQLVLIILVVLMRKRTRYGNDMLGQILGLREFIMVADQDRLQQLCDENPYYFYDILPYAYALGLTEIWNEHFKDLNYHDCDWFVSYYDYPDRYSMCRAMESQMHIAQGAMASIPESASEGGGSSGGGFSGGGGFGGSSGGSW